MTSPFAALDRNKRKQSPTPPVPASAIKPLSRSNSSLLFNQTAICRTSSTESKESESRVPSPVVKQKKTSLTSVLRAQSKFSGKSSVVSSKSRSSVVKPAAHNDSSTKNQERLKRSLPWATTTGIHIRPNVKLRESNILDFNKKFKNHHSSQTEKNNSTSTGYLQSIDTSVEGIPLSHEQRKVIDLILNQRKNVFFTGSAGTGKSFLLKIIIQKLLTRYGKGSIGISAPTGLAAANIGGQTIQRLFGIGLGKESADYLLNKIKKNMEKYMTWRRMVVLIIDEISMLDMELFEKLNYLAKKIKRNEDPFGGIQIIICGDFLQLPPITRHNVSTINYCFKSKSWNEVINESIILTQVFRQRGDSELIDILNALRVGKIDYRIENKLRQLGRPIKFDDGIEPTELFPTRNEVETSNLLKLRNLDGPEIVFKSKDISTVGLPIDENALKSFENLMCAGNLKLKVGAQVMLIKNDVDERLVNGQLGIVEAFLTKPVYHSYVARFGKDSSAVKIEILQKIGLMILNMRNLTNIPENDDLSLVDEHTGELIQELLRSYNSKDELLPLVNFSVKDESRPIQLLIEPKEFKPDFSGGTDNGFVRIQLPIILAWSMSIHKSQGQTLQRVKVDLRKIFEKGQLYVAISRCVSSSGLQVLNFDRRKIFVDEEVISFYNSITK